MDARRQRIIFLIIGLFFVAGVGLFLTAQFSPASNTSRALNGSDISLPELPTPPKELDPKLASSLRDMLEVYVRDGESAARDYSVRNHLIDDKDVVHVTLELDTSDPTAQQEIVRELEKRGVTIEAAHVSSLSIAFTLAQAASALEIPTPGPGTPFVLPTAVDASIVPRSLLEELAGLKHVKLVRLPDFAVPPDLVFATSQPTNEAKAVIKADEWHSAGITGKDVKVGIIDMDYLGYEDMLGTSLPKNVHTKSFGRDQSAELAQSWDLAHQSHGTACAEVIHALAPDAELYLGDIRQRS